MLRRILAVIGGVAAGGVLIALIEMCSSSLHPLPKGFKMDDYAALLEHAKNAPLSAQILVIVAWAVGALLAGFVSTLIAKNNKLTSALICASFFLASTIFNLITIPSPLWFWILGIILWFPLAVLGFRLARKK